MNKQFTMSMYASAQDLYEAKSKYYMEQCEQLQKENDELKLELVARFGELQTLLEENDELKAHVERLREALKPLVRNVYTVLDGKSVIRSVDDIQNLQAVLQQTPAQSLRHIESRVEEETIERCAKLILSSKGHLDAALTIDDMPRKYKEQSDD